MRSTTISNEALIGVLTASLALVDILSTKKLTEAETEKVGVAALVIGESFAQWLKDNPDCEKIYNRQQNERIHKNTGQGQD